MSLKKQDFNPILNMRNQLDYFISGTQERIGNGPDNTLQCCKNKYITPIVIR